MDRSQELVRLIKGLKDQDPSIRHTAAWNLTASVPYDGSEVAPLIGALREDTDPKVRALAAEALGKTRDSRAVEPLVSALRDTDIPTRSQAAKGLGTLKNTRGVEPLISILSDEKEFVVRFCSVIALGEIGDARAVDCLIDIASHYHPLQREAVSALGQIEDARAEAYLLTLLDGRQLALVSCAHDFYIRLGKPGTESVLIDALNEHGNSDMAEDLGVCGNPLLEKAARQWWLQTGSGWSDWERLTGWRTGPYYTGPKWGQRKIRS